MENDLLNDGKEFFKDFEPAFHGSPISKTGDLLGFPAGEKSEKVLEFFLCADVDDLLFEEFFKFFFIRDIDEFKQFLFVNGEACLFVGSLT